MATEIFKNQTTNAVVNAKVSDNGIMQVDISGVLDGADVLTSYIDDAGIAILIRNASWMTTNGDVLDAGDGAPIYIQKRNLRFSIINAGGSTDISLFVTHETGSINVI